MLPCEYRTDERSLSKKANMERVKQDSIVKNIINSFAHGME
jgi:hypothetical protein